MATRLARSKKDQTAEASEAEDTAGAPAAPTPDPDALSAMEARQLRQYYLRACETIERQDLPPEVRLVVLALELHGPLTVPELRKRAGLTDPEVVGAMNFARVKKLIRRDGEKRYALREVA